MARPLRIEYASALYHVTSRGDRGEAIYEDDGDRQVFLTVLENVVQRFGWVCHAYCLMGNHYHLLLETPIPNLARGMRQINGVYTQKYNFMHRKVGHLFQGRYKAIVIEKDAHLMEVCRYVVLNPVRALLVERPREWRWSSYRATAGLRDNPPFLTTDWILSQFGGRRRAAQQANRAFVREGRQGASPWDDLVDGLVLGGGTFATECRARVADDVLSDEQPRSHRHLGRPPLSELFDGVASRDKPARNEIIARAYLEHGYSMKQIAACLGLHYMTISRAVRAVEGEM